MAAKPVSPHWLSLTEMNHLDIKIDDFYHDLAYDKKGALWYFRDGPGVYGPFDDKQSALNAFTRHLLGP